MDGRYVVRPYQSGDEHGIVRLFNRVFSVGDARFVPRDLAAWRWKFASDATKSQIMLAVDEATHEVVAQYAALVVRYCVRGATDVLTQPVESMVDPAWRRTRVFIDTARRYFEVFGNARECVAGYGFPNPRALRIGCRQLAYVPIFAPVPTLFANLFAPGRWQSLAALPTPLPVMPVSRFESDVDTLWRANCHAYPFAAVRDAAFLNWRFADAPMPHRLFVVRERASTGLRAAFVLRAGWCADSIMALADYSGDPDDADALQTALAYAMCDARSRGFGRVEAWFPPCSAQFAAASKMGFDSEPSPVTMVARFYRTPMPVPWWCPSGKRV